MSNVINLFKAGDVDLTVERLAAIRDLLSVLDVSNIRAPKQMLRALWMLDIANSIIQIILADFRATPNQEQLVRQSEKLVASIEAARERVVGLGKDNLARRAANC